MTEVAHYGALAPVLFLLIFRREASIRYWLIALGFSVSWFADLATAALEGSWAVGYAYPPLQLGLFGWAFGAPWLFFVLIVLAGVEVVATTLEGPEIIVRLVGALAVLYVSAGKELVWTMIVYCGIGTGLYLLMTSDIWSERYLGLWYGYQSARLLAFGLFIREAWRA